MATADEILAGAVEVASEGTTQDKVLRIDNELRTISIPSAVKLLGVESDDDVNRIEFEMPRHYGEFDLSTFSVRVNYMNANGDGDIYKVVDLVADEEKMTFSWLVGRTAFMYKGDVQFVVCLKKIAEDFVVEQEFNTTVASLPVLQGLEPDEQLMQKYPDIIEQILKYMETPVSSEEIGKAVEEYLKGNPVGWAIINDDEVSAGSAWSSQKVSTQIDEKVSAHNTDPTAHTDVRELISGLTNRLNALADSDDTTLDQLSEIVAYIKSNKSLIDAITTSKVSVSDIVDDLVTNSSNKPLSAAQGVKLKALIDAIVPITVDSVLSSTSTNPVQNRIVLSGLNEKENKGAARSVQIRSNSYTPNESGVIDLSSGVATAEEVSSLKDDLTAEQTARSSADQALANSISDAWVAGKTFAVGDYCISGNRLYKCKTAHTSGSSFSSSYWTAVSVAGEIAGRSAVSDIASSVTPTSQTKYDISELVCKTCWNLMSIGFKVTGKTNDAYPNGQEFTQVLTLPRKAAALFFPSFTALNGAYKPIQVSITPYGTVDIRGGSVSGVYYVMATVIIS